MSEARVGVRRGTRAGTNARSGALSEGRGKDRSRGNGRANGGERAWISREVREGSGAGKRSGVRMGAYPYIL